MTTAASDVRLTTLEREGIRRAVVKACAEAAAEWRRIVLFGSRTDPALHGGDIDLLIELCPGRVPDLYRLTQRLRLALEDEIGAQRIDLVLDDGRSPDPFAALARETGVELWSNA